MGDNDRDNTGISVMEDSNLTSSNHDYVAEEINLKTPDPTKHMTENALRVLERRYLMKNMEGEIIETPAQMFHRVADNIARAELEYKTTQEAADVANAFYNIMARLEFLPNSPTLMNAGRELQQLSACFVLPVGDSMESIFDAVRNTALIHKSGGGTGFSFSRLRPSGSRVKSTSGVSSGPVSFMRVFDAATESVKQGGTRRGANMGILRIDHPDILQFIDCKKDMTQFTNFNISVAITDEFMKAVEKGGAYNLMAPHNGEVTGTLDAREVYAKIIDSAWGNGDPGIVFIDRINRDNPTPHSGEIEATNPCGEQPLLPFESCNLGSINLSRMVDEDDGMVDWGKLRRVTHLAVRFLDNVIDMNNYPLAEIDRVTKTNRKIGLGVMGWADMLIKLEVAYNSDEAITLASEVMGFIDKESKKASAKLAKERGAFPSYEGSALDKEGARKIRNATTTTIAPTGTISIIASCSSGVEPLFALSYVRNVMDNDKLVELHPIFEKVANDRKFASEDLMERVAYTGHIEDEKDIPAKTRDVFITAHGISPEWHIRTQAAFQRHIDNAVSKTVNFPNSATEEDVAKAYSLAYQLGCKGITIYRDGSRAMQVLSTGATNDKTADETSQTTEEKTVSEPERRTPKPRPEITFGSTQKINTGCGGMYVTINQDEDGAPFELFTQIGKAGGCAASQTESIGRLVSLALRAGVDIEQIRKQLLGISCHQPAWEKGVKITSCADAISKGMGRWIRTREHFEESEVPNGTAVATLPPLNSPKDEEAMQIGGACPECGSALQHIEGCLKCEGCGYSKC